MPSTMPDQRLASTHPPEVIFLIRSFLFIPLA
jgi:hypothetical protein